MPTFGTPSISVFSETYNSFLDSLSDIFAVYENLVDPEVVVHKANGNPLELVHIDLTADYLIFEFNNVEYHLRRGDDAAYPADFSDDGEVVSYSDD